HVANVLIEYAHLPRIDWADVRLLWYSGFWDGPINGMCLYKGRRCWFQLCAEGEQADGSHRSYLVLVLTKEQLDEEEFWHDLFRRKVGTHTDYDEDGKEAGQVLPGETWHEFYDEFAKRGAGDYSANPALGWFELR